MITDDNSLNYFLLSLSSTIHPIWRKNLHFCLKNEPFSQLLNYKTTQEREKLKALRKSIEASKAHLAELENQHKTLEASLPKEK